MSQLMREVLAEVDRLNDVIKERDSTIAELSKPRVCSDEGCTNPATVGDTCGLHPHVTFGKPRRDMTLTAERLERLADILVAWLDLPRTTDAQMRNELRDMLERWSREGQGAAAVTSSECSGFQTPIMSDASPTTTLIQCQSCGRVSDHYGIHERLISPFKPPVASDLAALRKSAALAFREVMFVDRPPLLSHYYDFVDKQAAYSAALKEGK